MGNAAANRIVRGAITGAVKTGTTKAADKVKADETAKKEAETAKILADNSEVVRQESAAKAYRDSVNATLDPVAQDFKTLGQTTNIQSNVDPAFRQYQLGLAAQLQQQANGQGQSIAQLQLQQATDRTLGQSLGQIRAATGANAGLSARTAALAGAQQLGQAGNASGQLRLQEQQQAQAMLGQIAGQGRSGDLQTNDQNMESQIQTGNLKLGALSGLAGVRVAQSAPGGDIYGSNAVDNRQAVGIVAETSRERTRATDERAKERRERRQKEADRILGALATGGSVLAGTKK